GAYAGGASCIRRETGRRPDRRVTPAALLAKEATQTIPIVMIVADPLATGLVPSLSRPGANLTGLSLASPDLAGKRLELVREIRPDIRTIAFLGSPNHKPSLLSAKPRRRRRRWDWRLWAGLSTAPIWSTGR